MGEDAPAKYVAEFVGTFMLVFTIGCNVLTGQPIWGAVSIACVLTVMVYSLANSSGANFNPAVSFALGITKNLEWDQVFIYSAVQIVAGICAGGCYLAMFEESFPLEPTKDHTMWQAGLAELLYTFMLCFVVLNTACSKIHGGNNQFYGLAIGFVIVAGAYSGGSVSMGCFNPAVAFGIDIASAYYGVYHCIVYTLWELAGAGLAAVTFKFLREEQEACATAADAKKAEVKEVAKLLSEFLGTYFLVLTVGLNVLSESAAGAFSIAAALMCMIYALGSVSGAHFNPAVTTALAVRSGGFKPIDAKFMGAQVVGGISAAFTYAALEHGETFALKPADSRWSQIVIAELVFTFVLCFVVLSVASIREPMAEYFGFAIGMCVTVGGFAIGKVSGGSLNPAVSFGISTSHAAFGGGVGGSIVACLAYTVIELLGGAAAAGAFMFTRPSEMESAVNKKTDGYGATA